MHWIRYRADGVVNALVDAKSLVRALRTTPYQRDWVDELQALQLKMEVAGTSRIEGAEFTDAELEEALRPTAGDLRTRSQRQARAAAETYRWIATLPDDLPIDERLILELHRRMVTGCDDDHCAPGRIRGPDENVTFGIPKHRGCEGGVPLQAALSALISALNREYRGHDPLVQAIALHYHFAAMHPFEDGNGRTSRALEALLLQRAGLRDTAFIAMSNYYHEEKIRSLELLAEVRGLDHDLTPFLTFALQGVAAQCERLLRGIEVEIRRAMFRNTMYDLFHRLKSPRRRVIADRQLQVLRLLLRTPESRMPLADLLERTEDVYRGLAGGRRARNRDLSQLIELGAVSVVPSEESKKFVLQLNLDWPAQIRESEFFEKIEKMPRAKTHPSLQG